MGQIPRSIERISSYNSQSFGNVFL